MCMDAWMDKLHGYIGVGLISMCMDRLLVDERICMDIYTLECVCNAYG